LYDMRKDWLELKNMKNKEKIKLIELKEKLFK
jgi:hypothetical protein